MKKPSPRTTIVWPVVLLVAVVLYLQWSAEREPAAPPPVAGGPPVAEPTAPVAPRPKATAAATPRSADELIVRNVTLRDEDRRTIYRGDIDLRPTLERIAAGRTLRFNNDGSTFQNREGRLPRKPSGYYEEWVVPTPGEGGPGPQRLVVGDDGDVWYTADHYLSFRRIRYDWPEGRRSAR